MSDVPWESEEKRNYICIQNLITDVVSEGLRNVFKNEWNTRYQARFGAWDDTNVSGQQLFHLENTRARPNKNVYQAKFQHGDTSQWDCSVLFDAILYSNSIGKSGLNPTIKTEVDNIRNMRNKIMHADETALSDTDFQTMISDIENAFIALGLPFNDITQMKVKRNLYKSFKVLPSKPTHEVVYRGEKVDEIKNILQTLQINSDGKLTYLYVSGNPGSGKSQLSRQLCESLYEGVNWETEATFVMTLNAKDLHTLRDGYEDFCRRLNCSESVLINVMNSGKPIDKKITDLRSLIESRIQNWKRWWLIVDNVETLEDISPLLPQMGDEVWNNGQIIVTIQNTTAVPSDSLSTKHISLSRGMKDQECRQLLLSLTGCDPNDPLLDKVAEKLDYQPLAIAAAAVYFKKIIDSNCSPEFSWHDYLEKLKSKREVTEEHLLRISSAYPSTMSAAVLLTVEKSAENSLILKHTFDLFSLISFEPLPVDIIVEYIQQLDHNCEREDVFLELKESSLFLFTESNVDVRLHRVVHEAVKSFSDCKETESKGKVSSKSANADIGRRVQNVVRVLYSFEARDDKIKIIPHLKAFIAAVEKLFPPQDSLFSISLSFNKLEIFQIYLFFGCTLEFFSEFKLALAFYDTNLQLCSRLYMHNFEDFMFSALGSLYKKMGDFEQALHYGQRALEIRLKQLGPDHVDVATSYNNIGRVWYEKGYLDQAKDYYHRALDIRIKQLGRNHVDVADSYTNIGLLCRDKGALNEAKDYHQQALEIGQKQLGRNHVSLAAPYGNIGLVCHDKGDLDKAKDYHQRALEILQKHLGSNHVQVADSYDNIGAVCHDKGDLVQAKDYHQRALEIRRKQLGPNHVDIAVSYSNIALVYRDEGDFDQAKDYLQRALEIQQKQLGSNHVNVATCYNNIGFVCCDKGELQEAIDYLQRALEIRKKHLGSNHVKVAGTYNNIGLVCSKKGDLEQANDYFQQALEIQQKQLGPNHFSVAVTYNNIGVVCCNKGDLDQAKDYYQRALEIQQEQLGTNHVDVAASYNNIGTVCHDKGDLDQAKDYHQRALEIRQKQLGPNHIDVAASYNNIGTVCHDKGDLDQAKDYLQRALEIQQEQLGTNHVDVAASYNNIGTVCRDKGDLDQAENYYERALEIRQKQLGPNHVNVAAFYNNIGTVCYDKRDWDQAKDYYQRALEIQQKQLGPNHVDVAGSYNNIGTVCHYKGDLDQAKDYHQRALEIRQKQLGPNHVNVAASYNNIGLVCHDKGDLDQAIDNFQQALKILQKQFSPNHVNVADSYNKIGEVCHDKGDLDQANDYHQRALKILLKQLGPNHVDVAECYDKIGKVCRDKGDLDQAEGYHQRALEIRQKQSGPNHPNYVDVAGSFNKIGEICHDKVYWD